MIRLSNTSKPSLIILIYAVFLTAFTAMMITMSVLQPDGFFASYGVEGDTAFQYSWSGRYAVILFIMLYGIFMQTYQGLFVVILSRFFIDVFDVVGIFIHNTPPFSWGNMAFLLFGLLIPQFVCLTILWRGGKSS